MVAKEMEKKRRPMLRRLLLILFIIVAAVGALAAYGLSNLNPIALSMAEARAQQLAVEALNEAIYEVMDSSVKYGDLMQVITDSSGQITMLQANTLLMNNLASRAALAAQRNLGDLVEQGIRLPLGAAFGIELFSGSGPNIQVSVVPVGSVSTKFVTAFESAGINQTRHQISLESSILMHIVIPSGANSLIVQTSVPIAESIIVGAVPETFVNIPDATGALNFVP